MTDEQALVFIGPMGAGKSSIGRRVAKRLGATFSDTDAMIVKEHGRIADIFTERGEEEFRRIEREIVQQALARGGVVALGGGAVLAPETQEALARHLVVHLTVSERMVASRIRGARRPLLNQGDAIEEWTRIATERRPVYDRLADAAYDTSHGPLRDVVDAAAQWAEQRLGAQQNGATPDEESESIDD